VGTGWQVVWREGVGLEVIEAEEKEDSQKQGGGKVG